MALGDGSAWNEAVPTNSTVANEIDDYDRDLRVGVRSRMAIEHLWPASQTGTGQAGQHRYVTLQTLTGAPAVTTGMGGVLFASSGVGLQYLSNTGTSPEANIITATGSNAASGQIVSGMILMWSGAIADIPDGWYLCDGNNSTPNLTNRFIVCADADDGGAAKTTLTGSATQSGDSNMAAHKHGIPSGTSAGGGTYRMSTFSAASSDTDSGETGTGTETYPKYYALAYIMKA